MLSGFINQHKPTNITGGHHPSCKAHGRLAGWLILRDHHRSQDEAFWVPSSPGISSLGIPTSFSYGGFLKRGTPKWKVYMGKSHENGWFGGTPISGNLPVVFRTAFLFFAAMVPCGGIYCEDEFGLGRSNRAAYAGVQCWMVVPAYSRFSAHDFRALEGLELSGLSCDMASFKTTGKVNLGGKGCKQLTSADRAFAEIIPNHLGFALN